MKTRVEVASCRLIVQSGNLYWDFFEISATNANHLVTGNMLVVTIPAGEELYTYSPDNSVFDLEVLSTRTVEIE
jgi:hypothetical protein